MSIYASLPAPDDTNHADGCASWEKKGGDFFRTSGLSCDCGHIDAPLVYQGSRHLPADTDARGGWVDISMIPSFITRDGRDDQPEDDKPWPFLRFGVGAETVVLTVHAARMVHATIGDWLAGQDG